MSISFGVLPAYAYTATALSKVCSLSQLSKVKATRLTGLQNYYALVWDIVKVFLNSNSVSESDKMRIPDAYVPT